MQILDAAQIASLVSMPQMIEAVRRAFATTDVHSPKRQVVPLSGGDGRRQLLIMPAFDRSGIGVVKLSTVFPDNPRRALPSIQGLLVVFSEEGAPVALLDGAAVTRWRTAAASACASSYLSRSDSANLLLIGSGALVPHMAHAHCSVRPIRRVSIWGRHPGRVAAAIETARHLVGENVEVVSAPALEAAVPKADIVCCATSSLTPVLSGEWLRAGTFVDLVGNFSPTGREADDAVMRGSRIYVDTLEGVLAEAGDLLDPLSRGVIGPKAIVGELSQLVLGTIPGRRSADEITLFKSVGAALEDLAAAQLIVTAARMQKGEDNADQSS
jgi:alanine dehydrogenase